jgi:D-amino-acid dehydrogenase
VPFRGDRAMTPSAGTADVVVIGGGIVGAALAYELVTAGADTVLVDRHEPGRATSAGAGILTPETNRDPDSDFFEFGMDAGRHYETLVARLAADGITDVGYQITGSILVAERPGDDAVMEEAVQVVGQRSPTIVGEIDPGDVGRLFPPLGPVRRALYNPAGRRVDGRELNQALTRAAVGRGLRVVHAGVTGIDVHPGRGRARGVTTSDGPVAAGAVALAGGAWSAELSRTLGVNLPVTPLKGQIVHLSLPDTDSRSWAIVQPVLGFYLVPWPDGRVACGGTMEARAGFDHRPTADGLHQLLREGLRSAPGLAQATVVEVRVGSRPATPDDRPILGPVPGWENVWVASGHGAEGLLLGPFSAKLVAAAVLATDASSDPAERQRSTRMLDRLSPARFAS